MLSFTYLLLSVGLVFVGALLWRLKGLQGSYNTAALSLWLGAYACMVNTPLFSLFIEPEMATLGDNLSVFVGFPMLALVLLDLTIGWHWKRATWGRIFLALAAMFEVMRRAEVGHNYAKFLFIVCALAILFALFKVVKTSAVKSQTVKKSSIILTTCFGLMLASLWSFNTSFVLLWNGLTILFIGGYLYFAAIYT